MSEKPKDPFKLRGAAALAASDETPQSPSAINLDDFAPRPRKVEPARAAAARVASAERNSRRTNQADAAVPPPVATPSKGRVRLSTLREDARPKREEPRAQLNIMAPASVILRWQAAFEGSGLKTQWQLLERAVELLEAQERGE